MNSYRLIRYIVFILAFFVVSCKNRGVEQNRMNETDDYLQLVENKINKIRDNNLNLGIDNQTVHFGIDSLNTMELKQAIANHLFFFYFSYETCSPCIQQTVDYIKKG